VRKLLTEDPPELPLVRRVPVPVEQADRDRLDPEVAQA